MSGKALGALIAAIALCILVPATARHGRGGSTSTSSIWFGATLPTLPASFSTTSDPPAAGSTCRGSYYTPGVGGDASLSLQTALNDAAAGGCANGDVIELQAGTTYTTTTAFNLPARSGSQTGWVYIISSDAPEIGGSGLPAAGTRVCPIASIGPSCATTNTSLSNMASIRSTQTQGGPIVSRSTGAAYYRLVGLDMEMTDTNGSANDANYYVVNWNNNDTSTSTLAQHITIDRCYLDGSPSYGVTHAIGNEGEYVEVTESYFGEHIFTLGNADTQDILAYNSIGPYKIHNNYLQAEGETTLFGGSDTSLPDTTEPSDITETNNSFYKNFFMASGSVSNSSATITISSIAAGYIGITMEVSDTAGCIPSGSTINAASVAGNTGTGTYTLSAAATCSSSSDTFTGVPTGKNMVEFKIGERVLFESNFLQNAGTEGQARSAFVLTSRSQQEGASVCALTDFTIENNFFGNAEFGGMNSLLQDSASIGDENTDPAKRILFRNNLFILSTNDGSTDTLLNNIQYYPVSGTGNPNSVIFDHNTFIGTASGGLEAWLSLGTGDASTLNNFVFSNNIFDASEYGWESDGSPTTFSGTFENGTTVITDLAFLNNVMTGNSDETLPSGNYSPANEAGVGYTSYGSNTTAAGYALTSSSTYHAKGVNGLNLPYTSSGTSDDTDIGANISDLPTS